ncbi:MAG TPA: glycosyltransferase [Egibacteraceae bacterium]|nr:glycosyltransferase [Egibacteraceae bacterium]
MRVAMVSEHASPLAPVGEVDAGGQNVHVGALAVALGRRGVRVTIHTRRDDPGLPRRVPLAPNVVVDHVDAGPPRPLPKDALLPHMDAFATDLRRCWALQPPDVVHAHYWMSGLAAMRAAAPSHFPLAQTFHALGTVKRRHQGESDTSPRQRVPVERYIARTADRVLATCRDEVAELAGLGADPTRVTVVPCGVDLDAFTPDGATEARALRRRLVVVGRLVERKGVGDVIAALADLPGVELVVAGGSDAARLDADPEVGRLRALARRLGVAERVQLRGRVRRRDLPGLLRSADAVVCPAWYEPFGIVPLEAMACGVPVVATAVGGMLDTVVDGVTGVHVPPRRPRRLAQALRALLGDARRRAAMGVAGRARVCRWYGWDSVADATGRAYEQLVAARRPDRLPEAVAR